MGEIGRPHFQPDIWAGFLPRVLSFLAGWTYNYNMAEAEYWDKIWNEHPAMRVNNFARRAFRRIQDSQFQTILDIGCGAGQDSLYFARRGMQVTALDIASTGLESLRNLNQNINCLSQDICRLDIPEHSYDVVYAHLSLQYFDDDRTHRIFSSIHHILKDNGLFFVKCKSVDDRLYGEGEKVGEDMFFYHHLRHFFSRRYMIELLEPFSIVSLRRTSSNYSRSPSAFIEAVARKTVPPH